MYSRFYLKFNLFTVRRGRKYSKKFEKDCLKFGVLGAGERLRLANKVKDVRSLLTKGYITARFKFNGKRSLPYGLYKYKCLPFRRPLCSRFPKRHRKRLRKFQVWRLLNLYLNPSVDLQLSVRPRLHNKFKQLSSIQSAHDNVWLSDLNLNNKVNYYNVL